MHFWPRCSHSKSKNKQNKEPLLNVKLKTILRLPLLEWTLGSLLTHRTTKMTKETPRRVSLHFRHPAQAALILVKSRCASLRFPSSKRSLLWHIIAKCADTRALRSNMVEGSLRKPQQSLFISRNLPISTETSTRVTRAPLRSLKSTLSCSQVPLEASTRLLKDYLLRSSIRWRRSTLSEREIQQTI